MTIKKFKKNTSDLAGVSLNLGVGSMVAAKSGYGSGAFASASGFLRPIGFSIGGAAAIGSVKKMGKKKK